MTDSVNTRELILGILMEVTKEGSYSHLVIRSVLDKYQYLEKKERAFITRVSEGTIQYMIELDYIINQFSKVKVLWSADWSWMPSSTSFPKQK